MVKGVFEHQFTSIKETSKEYQATIYGQAGFKIGRASRPTAVVRNRAKRAREKDISLNVSGRRIVKDCARDSWSRSRGRKWRRYRCPHDRRTASTKIEGQGTASS
jgi:hypothetical protein